MIEAAIEITARVHRGQRDKAGESYVWHPLRVGESLRRAGEPDHVICAGVLHDAIEDARDPGAARSSIHRACGPAVLRLVETLTHRKDETYTDYILRVSQSRDATVIKLADLNDNLDPVRMAAAGIAEPPQKYIDARRLLLNVAALGDDDKLVYEREFT
jgi:(p)ppGpp synthase/HD superfamily hydrolase